MLETLQKVLEQNEEWLEIRYHKRQLLTLDVRNGVLKKTEAKTLAGAGIRALVDGCWGFVATSDMSLEGLQKACDEAIQAAREAGTIKEDTIKGLGEGQPASGVYYYVDPEAQDLTMEEKIGAILSADEELRSYGEDIVGSITNYAEFRDHKWIVSSTGANVEIYDQKCDVSLAAIGFQDGNREMAHSSNGVTGTWHELFSEKTLSQMAKEAVEVVRQKLKATYAPGGKYTVIMDPALVGILAHEAIGHTVEADFVASGSVVQGKIGEMVASELITMVDDGTMERAAGMVQVDDEGTLGERTVIIENGVLKEYLHNLESAYSFNTKPHGNARAYTYRVEPLIRMTNTFILPGEDDLEDMIQGIEEGLFVKEMGQGGQADATAEFMFSVQEAYWIRDGKIAEPVKGITISGQAFDVLKSVDAVSKDFAFGMGRGYCGKWQPAKVDGGGPYLRCTVTIGGQQT